MCTWRMRVGIGIQYASSLLIPCLDALNFYKAHGFQVVQEVKEYYKRMKGDGSRDAYVLSKQLG